VFAARDERAQILSKAHAAVRDRQWLRKATAMPSRMASEDKLGLDPTDEELAEAQAYGERAGGGGLADISNKRATAYGELMSRAEELRKRFPALSRAQAFARIYEHPGNAQLAAAERRANRPRVG
jgi:hypothetical protein